ncbi:MAG: cytochrome c maturation protein CcmE [Acidimicrobiales bacterium]|jgi:cytochrome c-type biogenesis protein CcmE|nr:cytochrome c maturation protein CcmE [Acidimicrobiales bacterium]MDP6900647.1 cytochrome c maturation protein CcmE [Acidimicrobiales bacterium]HJL98936.1 cytochrome c maturation protein CcmE [Acidimicrobiales bacterium]
MDLTPRHEVEAPDELRQKMHRRRRRTVLVVALILVAAMAFITAQGLRNATLFFRNADEAVEQRAELGDRRFRIQGRVIPSTVKSESGVTTFEIVHDCAVVSIRHSSDPPELFNSPWIPVVLEGSWLIGEVRNVVGSDTHYFASDRMLVKHTNEYASANEQRLTGEPPEGFLDQCLFEVPAATS